MKERTYCVYQIYNKVEDKCYIGSTCNFERRIKEHKKDNTGWHIDFNQHPENWIINILEDNISDTNVKERELYFICLYDAIDNGYNKNHAGNHTNLEIREKMSKSISKALKGHIVTKETKKKMSESLKGHYVSEETKKKLSESHKGISIWSKGKHLTEDHKRKLSEARKGIKHTVEAKQKISDAAKGKIWINNNNVEKFINPDELQKYIDLGYQRGRKPKK